jgi:hypothetical protein
MILGNGQLVHGRFQISKGISLDIALENIPAEGEEEATLPDKQHAHSTLTQTRT